MVMILFEDAAFFSAAWETVSSQRELSPGYMAYKEAIQRLIL